jgi:hypothetical protein
LDEVTDTTLRLKVVKEIESLISANPHNKFIITSRKVGYNEARISGDMSVFTTEALPQTSIKMFIEQWYKWYSRRDRTGKDGNEAQHLIESIFSNESVAGLAENPLLLTIIVMIHYRGKSLPNRRVELYEVSADTLLENWVRHRLRTDENPPDKKIMYDLLSPIAYYIHENDSDGIPEDKFSEIFESVYSELTHRKNGESVQRECRDFLDFLNKKTGLFIEKGIREDVHWYDFLHQTFREYFCAIELVKMRSERDNFDISTYVHDSKWYEVLRLAAATIGNNRGSGKRDASHFIEQIVELDKDTLKHHDIFLLLGGILRDDVDIARTLLEMFFERFIARMSIKGIKLLQEEFAKQLGALLHSRFYAEAFMEHIIETQENTENPLKDNLSLFLVRNSKAPVVKRYYMEVANELSNISDCGKLCFMTCGEKPDVLFIEDFAPALAKTSVILPINMLVALHDYGTFYDAEFLRPFRTSRKNEQVKVSIINLCFESMNPENKKAFEFVSFWRQFTCENLEDIIKYMGERGRKSKWFENFKTNVEQLYNSKGNCSVVIINVGDANGYYLFCPHSTNQDSFSLFEVVYEEKKTNYFESKYITFADDNTKFASKKDIDFLRCYYCDQIENLSEKRLNEVFDYLTGYTAFNFEKREWLLALVRYATSSIDRFYKSYKFLLEQLNDDSMETLRSFLKLKGQDDSLKLLVTTLIRVHGRGYVKPLPRQKQIVRLHQLLEDAISKQYQLSIDVLQDMLFRCGEVIRYRN